MEHTGAPSQALSFTVGMQVPESEMSQSRLQTASAALQSTPLLPSLPFAQATQSSSHESSQQKESRAQTAASQVGKSQPVSSDLAAQQEEPTEQDEVLQAYVQ